MSIKIILDSLNAENGSRLTTVAFTRFWKLLQAEIRTHRSFSQSHYSSRAIPVEKAIAQVENDPYIPIWTKYKKGMGGVDNALSEEEETEATVLSLNLRSRAVEYVRKMLDIGVSKQEANRYLEPWMHGAILITGDAEAWESFFELRCPDGVQPDLRELARECQRLYKASSPQILQPGDWHIPFMNEETQHLTPTEKRMVSAPRCARISYNYLDGKEFHLERDLNRFAELVAQKHWTPLEHQAIAMFGSYKFRNFKGWKHQRHYIEEAYNQRPPAIIKTSHCA